MSAIFTDFYSNNKGSHRKARYMRAFYNNITVVLARTRVLSPHIGQDSDRASVADSKSHNSRRCENGTTKEAS